MKREVVVSGPVHFGLTFINRLKAVRSLSSRFLATNASEFLNEERERVVVSGTVRFGLTFKVRLKAVCGLSSRFLATNASEFLNKERELLSQVLFTLALLSAIDLKLYVVSVPVF